MLNLIIRDLGILNFIFCMLTFLIPIKLFNFHPHYNNNNLAFLCIFQQKIQFGDQRLFLALNFKTNFAPNKGDLPITITIDFAHGNHITHTSWNLQPNSYFHFFVVAFGNLGSCSKSTTNATITRVALLDEATLGIGTLFNEISFGSASTVTKQAWLDSKGTKTRGKG